MVKFRKKSRQKKQFLEFRLIFESNVLENPESTGVTPFLDLDEFRQECVLKIVDEFKLFLHFMSFKGDANSSNFDPSAG